MSSKRFSHTFQTQFPSSSLGLVDGGSERILDVGHGTTLTNLDNRKSGRTSLRVTTLWSMATELDRDVDDDVSQSKCLVLTPFFYL
jgi:hypothetical protein